MCRRQTIKPEWSMSSRHSWAPTPWAIPERAYDLSQQAHVHGMEIGVVDFNRYRHNHHMWYILIVVGVANVLVYCGTVNVAVTKGLVILCISTESKPRSHIQLNEIHNFMKVLLRRPGQLISIWSILRSHSLLNEALTVILTNCCIGDSETG